MDLPYKKLSLRANIPEWPPDQIYVSDTQCDMFSGATFQASPGNRSLAQTWSQYLRLTSPLKALRRRDQNKSISERRLRERYLNTADTSDVQIRS